MKDSLRTYSAIHMNPNKNHRKGDSDCYFTACGFFQHLRVLKDMIDHLYGSCEIETIGDPFIDRDTK